jgi:hypothetical protein
MEIDLRKILAMFDYLAAPAAQTWDRSANGILVVGSHQSFAMAAKAAELFLQGGGRYLVLTGSLTHQSRHLEQLGRSPDGAVPLGPLMAAVLCELYRLPADDIYPDRECWPELESEAALRVVLDEGLPSDRLNVVIHPTWVRYHYARLQAWQRNMGMHIALTPIRTSYQWSLKRRADVKDAVQAMLALATLDVPPNVELLAYAQAVAKQEGWGP